MIAFLIGKVATVTPQYVVVENNGIGYQIFTPNPFIFHNDETVTIYTYQYVREDTLALYGFQTKEEKELFIKLLNVTGIGPKGGLAILAAGRVDQLVAAIEREDESFLTKFPGVGKKTARQIILDLKGKLEEFIDDLFTEPTKQTTTKVKDGSVALEEACEALQALGYSDREIRKVKPLLQEEALTTDQYIKRALQLLLNQ
ncbi:Holliday junction branch migration protein RuvA [Bacillus sp. HMF5848]|uniref:Holliday junction branch migration protein RuvA n=1 Tax=Bacillus sp. HMF5848 TaxID=2495421 RepID=UPI000F77868D|nr:Holliday junction branch migration protein RuvA [Bacillus sp. HMF5848]RSK27999.1 Holliday junction branch migration protein RuvA [Bacillus sp. HMF5848]